MTNRTTSVIWLDGEPEGAVIGIRWTAMLQLRLRALLRFKRVCRAWPVAPDVEPIGLARKCQRQMKR